MRLTVARNRLSTLACARLPVLLLPGDVFATRVARRRAAGNEVTCKGNTRQ